MSDLQEKKRRLLEKKQNLINRLLIGLSTRPATKVGLRLASRLRRVLQIEAHLADLERQESRSS